MTTTTIKVSTQTRDRLKEQAAAAGMSLGRYVSALSEAADRQARLAALGAAIAGTSAADMVQYGDEVGQWEATELADGR